MSSVKRGDIVFWKTSPNNPEVPQVMLVHTTYQNGMCSGAVISSRGMTFRENVLAMDDPAWTDHTSKVEKRSAGCWMSREDYEAEEELKLEAEKKKQEKKLEKVGEVKQVPTKPKEAVKSGS